MILLLSIAVICIVCSILCILLMRRNEKVYQCRVERLNYIQGFIDKSDFDKVHVLFKELKIISYEKMLLKFWIPVDNFLTLKF